MNVVSSAPDLANLQRIAIKVFVSADSTITARDVIPVFHRWIQTGAVNGLPIDVANYSHLPTGPCVLLVGHEGHYVLDRTEGRLGVQYNRKQPLEGSLADRLLSVTRHVVRAARLLEADASFSTPVRFLGNEVEIVAQDRLLAPNSDETLVELRPALDPLLTRWSGNTDWTVSRKSDPRAPFRVAAVTKATDTLENVEARLFESNNY